MTFVKFQMNYFVMKASCDVNRRKIIKKKFSSATHYNCSCFLDCMSERERERERYGFRLRERKFYWKNELKNSNSDLIMQLTANFVTE